jgi:hypothetical protein
MAEAGEGATSVAAPEVQEKAKGMGWIPPEQFKGAPEKFIDADVFVERAEQYMPIMRRNNEILRGELGQTKKQMAEMKAQLDAAAESLATVKEFNAENAKRIKEQAREDARKELAEARSEGDVDREAAAIETISNLGREPEKQQQQRTEQPVGQKDFTKEPDFIAWNEKNPWLGVDSVKSGTALGIMGDLRNKGDTSVGREFFEKVDAALEKIYGSGAPGASRVEGARHSGGGGGGAQSRSYADLPAEARAACDRTETKVVGPGRAYKNQAEWRKYYVQTYFSEE